MIVTPTDEFARIVALPRRDPRELMGNDLALAVTRALSLSSNVGDNARTLFPIQAASIVSACRSVELGSPGAVLPIGVGEGKTDITFTLPHVLDAHRAVLLVPGSLTTTKAGQLGKTERDFMALRKHWVERRYGQILSYQRLGRANGGDLLLKYRPDLLVCDEAHMLRNQDNAACARVVVAYVKAARAAGHRVLFVILSGTLTGGKLGHMAHLVELALGDRSFLPRDEYDLDMWRRAVDAEVEAGGRLGPGCLLEFCEPEDLKGTQLQRARRAIRRRMHSTEGVIASTTHRVRSSLRFGHAGDAGGGVPEATWHDLRDGWRLPNDDRCLDGLEAHRHAREYACGYWSEWDPAPPKPWYKARKAWAKLVYQLVRDRYCNTEVEARAWVELNGHDDGVAKRDAWLAIRDTFVPNPVARWLSSATVDACAAWAKRHKSGIIWTQHVPFGIRLERDHGIPYYREQGLTSEGAYIEHGSGVICASVQANATGRNLQGTWSDNLIVSPFGSAELNEQLYGRTHRTHQKADTVHVDFLIECREHVGAIKRARERAAAIELMTDNPQKLCYGDWAVNVPSMLGDSARWQTKIGSDADEKELDDEFLAELFNPEANDDNDDEVEL